MRPGGERRGNARDRRRRKLWMLATFDTDLGPDRCRCWLDLVPGCLVELDVHSVTADRIDPGGTYRRENVQPACTPCQNAQGALITHARRLEWRQLMAEAERLGIEWDGVMG